MTKEELINCCRYYNGTDERNFKDSDKNMLAFYEKIWVHETLDNYNFEDVIDDYNEVGLGSFQTNDGIPVTLKALLFNRYARTCYTTFDAVEPFKKFYKEYYN